MNQQQVGPAKVTEVSAPVVKEQAQADDIAVLAGLLRTTHIVPLPVSQTWKAPPSSKAAKKVGLNPLCNIDSLNCDSKPYETLPLPKTNKHAEPRYPRLTSSRRC
eukprot:9078018-Pyramimonas_sp.AAC.1